jgi:hypothetical protein
MVTCAFPFQERLLKEIVMGKHTFPPVPPGKRLIFRPWKTDPQTGERIYASQFGKRAFAIIVDE